MAALVDTGSHVAYANRRDHFHALFRRCFDVEASRELLIVPVTVLPEVDYLVSQLVSAQTAADLLERIVTSDMLIVTSDMLIEQVSSEDVSRSIELMRQYADSNIGFVDASLVAVAERLGI